MSDPVVRFEATCKSYGDQRVLRLDDEALERVEGLTRSLVNKILHAPLARLRAQTDREEGLAVLEAARELFALDDEAAPGAHIDGEFEAGTSEVASRDRGAGDGGSE